MLEDILQTPIILTRFFSWTTATCMTDSLISPWGCLTTLQRDLEELKLVLSAKCPDEQLNLYLGSFRKLRYLSVRGIRNQPKYPSFYHSLKAMMLGSCSTLKEFELAAVPDIDQAPYCEALEGKQFLPVHITKPSSSVPWEMSIIFHHPWPYTSDEDFFPAQPLTDGFLFPNLRVLHLEMIKLTDCANRLVQTIDVASMTSLTLRHCQGWNEFLLLMAKGTGPMSLRKLELEYYEGTLPSSDLINLLNRCANIEEVAICDADEELPLVALQTWKSVCHGRPSLRRFVHHQADHFEKADWLTPTEDPRLGVDVGGDEFLRKLSECISSPGANPFTYSNLEFLGICCFPTDMLVSNPLTHVLASFDQILTRNIGRAPPPPFISNPASRHPLPQIRLPHERNHEPPSRHRSFRPLGLWMERNPISRGGLVRRLLILPCEKRGQLSLQSY